MSEIAVIQDRANVRSISAAIAAEPGSIAIENIAGVLKQVDDQGVASAFGSTGAPTDATYLTKSPSSGLSAEIALSTLSGPGLLQFAADGSPTKAVGADMLAAVKLALATLGGPGLLQFAADGTATKAAAANLITALQLAAPLMNEVITASGLTTALVLAPANWTLNGDTDGDYVFEGEIITPAGTQATSYNIEPSALSTNQTGRVMIDTGPSTLVNAALTGFFIGSGTVNAGRITFRATLTAKSGRVRFWRCVSMAIDPTAVTAIQRMAATEWTGTATVIDPTTQLAGSAANGIGAGSFVKITRNLMAA